MAAHPETPDSVQMRDPRHEVVPELEPDDLTDRQQEVLALLVLGHTNAETAARLYLSVRTVEAHRAHIQQKLRCSSRAELVRYAIDQGLFDDRAEQG